jgi:hypothetical protein
VFQLSKRIEMSMVEEQMVTLGFNKEIQGILQHHWAKGAKPNFSGGSTSYYVEEGGEDKCWRCGGPHKKKDCPNPLQTTTSNPNPN